MLSSLSTFHILMELKVDTQRFCKCNLFLDVGKGSSIKSNINDVDLRMNKLRI